MVKLDWWMACDYRRRVYQREYTETGTGNVPENES